MFVTQKKGNAAMNENKSKEAREQLKEQNERLEGIGATPIPTMTLLSEPGEKESVHSPFANSSGQVAPYPTMIAQSLIGLTQPEVSKTVTTILLASAAAIQVYDKRTTEFAEQVGKLANKMGFVTSEGNQKKGKKSKDKKDKKKKKDKKRRNR